MRVVNICPHVLISWFQMVPCSLLNSCELSRGMRDLRGGDSSNRLPVGGHVYGQHVAAWQFEGDWKQRDRSKRDSPIAPRKTYGSML